MALIMSPDVIVYVCRRSLSQGVSLPRQWKQDGVHIMVHEVPCSGKMDGQYLMHALEGGACGVCVVACPKGECHLGQGNYRAEIRIGAIKRLLGEIGIEPERAELFHLSPNDPSRQFDEIVQGFVQRISTLGKSPIGVEKH